MSQYVSHVHGGVAELTRTEQTVYDVWKTADGIFEGEPVSKTITFRLKNGETEGWVKVTGGEEAFATNSPNTFSVPPNHRCEVLGCIVKFTRA